MAYDCGMQYQEPPPPPNIERLASVWCKKRTRQKHILCCCAAGQNLRTLLCLTRQLLGIVTACSSSVSTFISGGGGTLSKMITNLVRMYSGTSKLQIPVSNSRSSLHSAVEAFGAQQRRFRSIVFFCQKNKSKRFCEKKNHQLVCLPKNWLHLQISAGGCNHDTRCVVLVTSRSLLGPMKKHPAI